MPIYTVELDGKQYDLEGDHPPSEAEARGAIGSTRAPMQSPGTAERNTARPMGNLESALAIGKAAVGGMLGPAAQTMLENPKTALASVAVPAGISAATPYLPAAMRGIANTVANPIAGAIGSGAARWQATKNKPTIERIADTAGSAAEGALGGWALQRTFGRLANYLEGPRPSVGVKGNPLGIPYGPELPENTPASTTAGGGGGGLFRAEPKSDLLDLRYRSLAGKQFKSPEEWAEQDRLGALMKDRASQVGMSYAAKVRANLLQGLAPPQ